MSTAAARCAPYGSARRRYAQTPTAKPSRSKCLTQGAPYEGGQFACGSAVWWVRRDREFAHHGAPRSRAFAHPTTAPHRPVLASECTQPAMRALAFSMSFLEKKFSGLTRSTG